MKLYEIVELIGYICTVLIFSIGFIFLYCLTFNVGFLFKLFLLNILGMSIFRMVCLLQDF